MRRVLLLLLGGIFLLGGCASGRESSVRESSNSKEASWAPCEGKFAHVPEGFETIFRSFNRPFLCAYQKGERVRLWGRTIGRLTSGRGYVITDAHSFDVEHRLLELLSDFAEEHRVYFEKRDIKAKIKVLGLPLRLGASGRQQVNVYMLKVRYERIFSGYLAGATVIPFKNGRGWYDIVLYTQGVALSEEQVVDQFQEMIDVVPMEK